MRLHEAAHVALLEVVAVRLPDDAVGGLGSAMATPLPSPFRDRGYRDSGAGSHRSAGASIAAARAIRDL